MAAGSASDPKLAELTAIIAEIRERVRARHPSTMDGGLPLPDLLPVLHARDVAMSKVASIGTVNPRPPGLVNGIAQGFKKLVARALDWHVREQVEFNRAAMSCIEAVLEALQEANRTSAQIAQRLAAAEQGAAASRDQREHWERWRQEWEQKLSTNEIQFLRSVADLQTAYQHRATLMEGNFRGLVEAQHSDFDVALEKATLDIQGRLWKDLERIRGDYERLIHTELRLVRQRAALVTAAAPAAPALQAAAPAALSFPPLDWMKFADRFRGSDQYVREKQRFYVESFQGAPNVLDIGCGRGEFLELMREAGVPACGIDLGEECVATCRAKGLAAERADLFEYLTGLADQSLGGIFCAQVVEHLPPERVPEFIRLAQQKLARGGVLAIETPNPECLAIFATHFFLDPTHTRPIPPPLLVFYFEEYGFGSIEVHRLSPAVESMPEVATLPEAFRSAFFGGLDYAVLGKRLA